MPRRKQQAPKRAAGKRSGFASGLPGRAALRAEPLARAPSHACPTTPPPKLSGESRRVPLSSLRITPSSLAFSDLPNPPLSSLRLGGGSHPTKPNLLKLFFLYTLYPTPNFLPVCFFHRGPKSG